MAVKNEFARQVWLATLLTLALTAALVFGIIVLARGDWIPGTITVVASLVGLGREIPVINRLCRQPPPQAPAR